MRCRVQLFVAGQIFTEEVRAVDYQEARQVALEETLMPLLLV